MPSAPNKKVLLDKFLTQLKLLIPDILEYGMDDDEAEDAWIIARLTAIIEDTYNFRSDFAYMLDYIGVRHEFSTSNGYGDADKVYWENFWPFFRDVKNGVKEIFECIVSDLWQLRIESEMKEDIRKNHGSEY